MFTAVVVAGTLALPLGFEIDLAEALPPAWSGQPPRILNFDILTADGRADRRFWGFVSAEHFCDDFTIGHLRAGGYAVRPVGKTKLVFTAHKGSRIVGAWFHSTDGQWNGTVRRVVAPPDAPKK